MVVPNTGVNTTQNVETINPSIGEVGRAYFDERNNRVKLLDTNIYSNSNQVYGELDNCLALMNQEQATRINARFFVQASEIENLIGNLPQGFSCEARVPMPQRFGNLEWLFIGQNNQSRMSPEEILRAENEIATELYSRTNRTPSRNLPTDYRLEMLDNSNLTTRQIESMVELYSEAFPTYTTNLDFNSIEEMISNGNTCGIIYNPTNEIVATSVAEIANISTNELGNMRICELSEMATRRAHRGKGLMQIATSYLINQIENNVDLIYAEARASHRPINHVFSDLGFKFGGLLNKQCILSGDSDVQERGIYENLNVVYRG